MSDPRTSYAMMTSIVVFHWLEAFAPEVAFGADSLRGESPPPRCGLASAPSGLEFHRTTDSALQKIRRYVADVVTKRMCVGAHLRGCVSIWGSLWPPDRIPNSSLLQERFNPDEPTLR
jgi:hypothetical protein